MTDLTEALARLSAAVTANDGSTVTITKADACALGQALRALPDARDAARDELLARDSQWQHVERVAWHIGKAVEYIDSQYPDAKMLDRGPIIRNMRRWHEQLTRALAGPQS